MSLNLTKHSKLIFKLLLIITFVSPTHGISQAYIKSETKSSSKDSILFTSIGFRKDTALAVKRSIWSEMTTFFVKDETDQKWELAVPPQFLMYGLQLEATPMLDIQVDSTFGEALAGIQLEPSGTMFSDPITINLTIDKALTESPVIFFMTDEKGNLTEIANQKREENTFTIEVTHFSGVVGFVPFSIENICLISAVGTAASIDKAKALFTNNPRIAVEPISFERKCDEEYARQLGVNIAQMMEPERTAISDILNYQRGVALTCNLDDLKKIEIPDEVYKLSDQLVAKALNAISAYKNQPEKFAAVGQFALIASRENSLIYSPNSLENKDKVFEALRKWLIQNIAYYKKKIAEEHDFQYIRTLTDSYANLNILAPEDITARDMITEIEKLLRFEMEIEAHVYRDCQGGDWKSNEYTISKGTVNMEFNFDFYRERNIFPSPNYSHKLVGEGTFFTEGKAVRKGREETDISTVIPDAYEKKYEIQLNFCELIGETKCVSPGNRREEWEGDEFINFSLRQIRYTNTFFNMLNRDHNNKGKFEFQIKNREAVLIDDVHPVFEDYDNGEQKIRTEFHYKLIHKPKY
jgi:hypothetical protein